MKKGIVLAVVILLSTSGLTEAQGLPFFGEPPGDLGITLDFTSDPEKSEIIIQATVNAKDRTGVEMEALVAVSTAALTIYDMCKSYDRGMIIDDIRLLEKSGGKSGHYRDSTF